MPQSNREISRRIKSIGNTKKITKAMELVAAAKMKKSVEATLASRFYAKYSWDILINLANIKDAHKHALLNIRDVKKVCLVLITSDKGLCGSYNSALLKKAIAQLNDPFSLMINRVFDRKIVSKAKPEDLHIDFICIGKKGAEILRKMNKNVVEVYAGIKDRPNVKDLKPVTTALIREYKNKNYDKIVVAYTDYFSVVSQIPKIRQLLPISRLDLEKVVKDLDTVYSRHDLKNGLQVGEARDYILEPNKDELLESVLGKLVALQLYQMVMESSASEHSARMMAMKNATESAGEMISELTLIYNKARQATITQEIAEISSGRVALEK